MLATGLAGSSWLHGAFIVLGFAVGTGLHLASHWLVAIAFGKGIDRMVLTRAGRIDYSGAEPGFVEYVVRTAAGPTMNGLCALAGYLVLTNVEWPPTVMLAVSTFTMCSWILLAINYLPAIPLDGGLILQRILTRFLGADRAQKLAAQLSLVLTLAVIGFGIYWRQPVLIYLGIVVTYDTWRTRLHLRSEPARMAS